MILFPEKPFFFCCPKTEKTKAIGLGKKLKCEDNFLALKPFKTFLKSFKRPLNHIKGILYDFISRKTSLFLLPKN